MGACPGTRRQRWPRLGLYSLGAVLALRLLRDTVLFHAPLWVTASATAIVGLLAWLDERRSTDRRENRGMAEPPAG